MAPPRDRKLAIMGYRSVGKSSITIQFCDNQFVESYDPTIENTFTRLIKLNNQDYRLHIVDTAGQLLENYIKTLIYLQQLVSPGLIMTITSPKEHQFLIFRLQINGSLFISIQDEYSMFPDSYALDIHGYILVYSVTSSKSFEVVKVIHDKLLDMVGRIKVPPLVLVGNKTDLHMERRVSTEVGQSLAQSWNAIFVETSAKHNLDVQAVFKGIIKEIERQDGNLPEDKKCVVS